MNFRGLFKIFRKRRINFRNFPKEKNVIAGSQCLYDYLMANNAVKTDIDIGFFRDDKVFPMEELIGDITIEE